MAWFAALSTGKKIAVGLGAIIALLLAVAALVSAVNAHDKAQRKAGSDAKQAEWNAETAERQRVKAEFTTELNAALQPRFDNLATQIGGIDTGAAKINVQLPQAIAANPRYRDPNCSVTGPALDQLNTARRLGGQP